VSDEGFQDVSAAVIIPRTEQQVAESAQEGGLEVVCHRGRYWQKRYHGFYEPVHWLARLEQSEATRPARGCWGFRTTLCDSAAGAANGVMPVHMLSGLSDYTMENLPAKRRSDLRKSRKQVTIVQLTSHRILEEQGYEVEASALQRIAPDLLRDRRSYLAALSTSTFQGGHRHVILAGLVQDKLAGYLTGYAVQDTAYINSVRIATQYFPTAVGTALAFDFVQVCKRSGGIRHVVYGQHSIENRPLSFFKEGMGFAVTAIPSRVWILPVFRAFIRWWSPAKFYRLTGLGADALKNREAGNGPAGDPPAASR